MTVKPKERGSLMPRMCCGLPREIYLDSPSAQQVCDPCKRHSTGDWRIVAETHSKWAQITIDELNYRRLLERGGEREVLAQKDAKIEHLESKLAEASATIVKNYFDAPLGEPQVWANSRSGRSPRS